MDNNKQDHIRDILERSEKIGELYVEKQRIKQAIQHQKDMIDVLVRKLADPDEKDEAEEEKKEVLRFDPAGFQKPTWDIYKLLPATTYIHIDEICNNSQILYGGLYSPSAIRASLYRLQHAGLVERKENHYFRIIKDLED